jgi:hypothetical protein
VAPCRVGPLLPTVDKGDSRSTPRNDRRHTRRTSRPSASRVSDLHGPTAEVTQALEIASSRACDNGSRSQPPLLKTAEPREERDEGDGWNGAVWLRPRFSGSSSGRFFISSSRRARRAGGGRRSADDHQAATAPRSPRSDSRAVSHDQPRGGESAGSQVAAELEPVLLGLAHPERQSSALGGARRRAARADGRLALDRSAVVNETLQRAE